MFPRTILGVVILISGVIVVLVSGTRRNLIFIALGIALYIGALAFLSWQAFRANQRKRKDDAYYSQDDDELFDDPPKVDI